VIRELIGEYYIMASSFRKKKKLEFSLYPNLIMGSYLSKEKQPPNKRKECHSEAFMYIPAEIILYITDFIEYFDDARVLK
jgi:hypothetical protein